MTAYDIIEKISKQLEEQIDLGEPFDLGNCIAIRKVSFSLDAATGTPSLELAFEYGCLPFSIKPSLTLRFVNVTEFFLKEFCEGDGDFGILTELSLCGSEDGKSFRLYDEGDVALVKCSDVEFVSFKETLD